MQHINQKRMNEMGTSGAHEMDARSGCSDISPAAPKKFGRAARRVPSPSGRSMIEMLAVLAIIGVLSIAALVGFTYAMNKHRANETIYDVMLRGTNVPMVDENYASKPSGYEFRFPDLPAGTYYPMTTKKDAGSSYYVEATGVTYRVCEMILKMNPTDIDQIVVNNSVNTGDSDICGTTDGLAMKFCFGEDGTICDGTGQGGSSGGSGSGSSGGTTGGSGSGTDPVDPCEGIIASTDCSISADETDGNGCVTVKKITCGTDTYCSGTTCDPCPVAETCDGESCCTLTGPNDVCGRPTKEVGTLSTVTHSDLNANGCCETTTEESCSLNPVTPRTCTPTCDGTCQSGVCESTVIASCNEITQHVCTNGTDEWCCNNGQSCGTEKESCGTCQINGKETCAKDGRPLSMGGCPENAEEICKACGLELVLYNTSSSGIASYKCGGQKLCGVNETWQAKGIVFYSDKTETTSTYTCVPNNYVKICYNYGDAMWGFDYYAPGTSSSHGTHEVPCEDLP